MQTLDNGNWLRHGDRPTIGAVAPKQWPQGPLDRPRPPSDGGSAADRAALRDELFGHGFLLPGGEPEIIRLVRPLHLSAAARLLVAGSGIGGPTLAIARRLGLVVSGYDRAMQPTLDAAPGSSLEIRTEAVAWDADRDTLPKAAFHHALALLPLGEGAPEPVLAKIIGALKPAGNLILLDYVASDTFAAADEEERAWLDQEHRQHPPPDAQDVSRALARLGMQVRDIEDMGKSHARLAVNAWQRVVDGIATRPSDLRGRSLLDEANAWALRIHLIQRGALRLMRWHCALPVVGE